MNSSLQSLILDRPDLIRAGTRSRNELLREFFTVPAIARELLPELKVVSLTTNQVLYEQGDKIEVVHFPLDSVVSGLAIMEDGTTMETSMTGREGLVGISSLLGSGRSRQWFWVTVGGSAIQLETKFIEKTVLQSEVALKAVLKAYRLLIMQLSQRSVCNTRHTIMERLCGWLLMIHDRVGASNLSLTQELIASRVGARRAGITVAAGTLQAMKAIDYRRGKLHIQDRPVLERTVCECYNLMRGNYESPPPDYSAFSL